MPKFSILKSVTIQAPIEDIYKVLCNFNHWKAWSPWLVMEPEAKVQISGDGKSYQWFGKRVGEGKMQILSEQKNKKIDYSLNFIKPWKSKADVSFSLTEKEGAVEVSWTMHSQLPFFMFWMKKMMIAFISMDYNRGLNMLKDLIEQGTVPSKLVFKGVENLPPTDYVGIKTYCSHSAIGDCMARDFTQLQNYVRVQSDIPNTQPFSIYHKWDIVKKTVEYTAAIPVTSKPQTVPAGFILGQVPATKIYTIRHIGPYTHIANAWSTLYNMQQNKELKCQKNIHPFEVYVNDPANTDKNDLITDISFPIK
jgi:predicted transcriptional regulator YdeE/uncharacterized protein YndB with AHSA1/START domain